MGDALMMALFLAVAALVVLSMVCKLLLAFGWVPSPRSSRLRRMIEFTARAVGGVRVTSGGGRGGRSTTKGGGSSGGGGASGDW
ncbi:hypothetical protein [Xanthobacter sp.]|uniref:hypothetical protein n=1 Tax=Xanthobacter sp. TaxID=35809 RepID=UPI0025FDC26B|nr:hypothetical protein [Xanthobacter sp.]